MTTIPSVAKRACLLALAAAAGCSDPIADPIHRQFEQSGRRSVDLGTAVPGPWRRVCIIGPYMNNADTHAALGFAWDSAKVSDVASNDGIVLLVFIDDADRVTSFTNYRRGNGDFSNLRGQCFARPEARFEQVGRPSQGWPGLFPAK